MATDGKLDALKAELFRIHAEVGALRSAGTNSKIPRLVPARRGRVEQ